MVLGSGIGEAMNKNWPTIRFKIYTEIDGTRLGIHTGNGHSKMETSRWRNSCCRNLGKMLIINWMIPGIDPYGKLGESGLRREQKRNRTGWGHWQVGDQLKVKADGTESCSWTCRNFWEASLGEMGSEIDQRLGNFLKSVQWLNWLKWRVLSYSFHSYCIRSYRIVGRYKMA